MDNFLELLAGFRRRIETLERQIVTTLMTPLNGWTPDLNTWTYASADSPVFTLTVNADLTSIIQAGDRIKLTQTTVKYFIVVKTPTYASGDTTITLYGGTGYTLANAAISAPYYSHSKAPSGFSLNPDDWTVEVTDSTDRTQASPTNGTWYNINSACKIDVPIGRWFLEYFVLTYGDRAAAGALGFKTTLSTGNTTESNTKFTSSFYHANVTQAGCTQYRREIVSPTSKTTYYLNANPNYASATNMQFLNSTAHPMVIRAICAYL